MAKTARRTFPDKEMKITVTKGDVIIETWAGKSSYHKETIPIGINIHLGIFANIGYAELITRDD